MIGREFSLHTIYIFLLFTPVIAKHIKCVLDVRKIIQIFYSRTLFRFEGIHTLLQLLLLYLFNGIYLTFFKKYISILLINHVIELIKSKNINIMDKYIYINPDR